MSKPSKRAGAPDLRAGSEIFYRWWQENGLSRDGGLTDPAPDQVRELLTLLEKQWLAQHRAE